MTELTKTIEPSVHPYDAGQLAAKAGQDHWENPHSYGKSHIAHFHAWYAGWCYGKQLLGEPKP